LPASELDVIVSSGALSVNGGAFEPAAATGGNVACTSGATAAPGTALRCHQAYAMIPATTTTARMAELSVRGLIFFGSGAGG